MTYLHKKVPVYSLSCGGANIDAPDIFCCSYTCSTSPYLSLVTIDLLAKMSMELDASISIKPSAQNAAT